MKFLLQPLVNCINKFQFAHQPSRYVDDAILCLLNADSLGKSDYYSLQAVWPVETGLFLHKLSLDIIQKHFYHCSQLENTFAMVYDMTKPVISPFLPKYMT